MRLGELSVARWRSLLAEAGAVDLRPLDRFTEAHLPGCAHIAADELAARLHELPPAGAPVIVVGDEPSLQTAQHWMVRRRYRMHACVEITPDDQWPDWAESGPPDCRLWQPNPFLQEHIDAIESGLGGPARVLDLGAGSGREAVWLALRGWDVLAVDNQEDVLARLQASARAWRTPVRSLKLDLRRQWNTLPRQSFELVLMCRFLLRELFPPIRDWLVPGGYFLVETFTTEAAAFGKPRNPNFLLKRHEIRDAFSSWECVASRERYLPDGRPLAGELVRKPVD
jgi:SAM-dependent methyltransferase